MCHTAAFQGTRQGKPSSPDVGEITRSRSEVAVVVGVYSKVCRHTGQLTHTALTQLTDGAAEPGNVYTGKTRGTGNVVVGTGGGLDPRMKGHEQRVLDEGVNQRWKTGRGREEHRKEGGRKGKEVSRSEEGSEVGGRGRTAEGKRRQNHLFMVFKTRGGLWLG